MTSPRVVVLDHGSGNVRSAVRALEATGADVALTGDRAAALAADGLVVPGVGAFASVARDLRAAGGHEVVAERLAAGRPVLGICVGLQVLFGRGLEHADEPASAAEGLGLWPGDVARLPAAVVPHMGWNTVEAPAGSVLFGEDPDPDERYYFVHSFAVQEWRGPSTAGVTWAEHGTRFVAAVEDGPLSATQFHPEKSGDAGQRLLRRWVAALGDGGAR
ncbi:imidazole glycerol phosphate synthase subunit HisH [Pseudokineococcus marinus]|uniref:Imidazole glycerol phosphate synthase subunit HisH n=1 Tax=Pseudokineococcus marinus TaxID=351215 RepID=A0A849BPM9_9ACTN|nr:imidazole glycerol phosphate synthase subunit HisH [Pseudokineococcus marinus]NNH22514.1 imidazole glycerol phosphate synthase subunit HisH [Pseudokineococcus marinus]